MDNEQQPQITPAISKTTFIVGIAIAVIVVLAVGSGVVAYEEKQNTTTQNNLQAQINSLKGQLATAISEPTPTVNPVGTATPTPVSAPTSAQIAVAVETYLAGNPVTPLNVSTSGGKVFYGKQLLFNSTQGNVTTATYYIFSQEYVNKSGTLTTGTGSAGEYVFTLSTTGSSYAVSNVIAPKNDQSYSTWVPANALSSVDAFEGSGQTSADITATNARKQVVENQSLSAAKSYYGI